MILYKFNFKMKQLHFLYFLKLNFKKHFFSFFGKILFEISKSKKY